MIRKITLATAIISLAACGDKASDITINSVNPDAGATVVSRLVFQPVDGDLAVPNDLLFSGSVDGTLEMPNEVASKDAGETVDFSDPASAIGALDGWSTMMPLQLSVSLPDGVTIDASSVLPATVVMLEAAMGGDDGACAAVPRGAACAPIAALTYGTDYVVLAGGDTLTFVPLKPLAADTTFLVGITTGIVDSRGEPVQGSELYEQVTQTDIEFGSDSLTSLQGVINSYEAVLAAGIGGNADEFIYSSAWTTASVGNALSATIALATAAAPSISNVTDTSITVEQALINSGALPEVAEGETDFANADLYSAAVTLPYYSPLPTESDPYAPITDAWSALCDSGVILAALEDTSGLTEGGSHAQCTGFGLADYGLDTERHITQYNPVPVNRDSQTLEVQVTVPNNVSGPWPIVILQHGIGSKKEDMLAVTGVLASAGFATIAIDHPLHGSRGFDLDGDDTDDINATEISATHYLNLSSLLTARDNLRQSMADMLALRIAIANGFSGDLDSDDFNLENIHVAGMSLGGIASVGYTALANANGLATNSAALIVPGGGIAPFLLESASFGNLIAASVLSSAGGDASEAFELFQETAPAACTGLEDSAETYLSCLYGVFLTQLTADGDSDTLVEISSIVSQFAFAAQTIIDAADPNNYATLLASLETPIYMAEIVGNDVDNLPDQVIPNQTVNFLFGGTDPLASYLGLDQVDDTAASGLVGFTEGSHSSLLSSESSLAVTTEMQTQLATFFATGVISVSNGTVVAPVE
jgi:Pla-1/cef family extracellular lipase